MAGIVHHVGIGVNDLSVHLIGPASVVAQAASGGTNITLGNGEGLAVVESFDGSKGVHVLLEEIGQLGEHASSVGRGDLLPFAIESGAGSLDGHVDILLGGLVDGGDGLFVVGVDGFEGLALYTFDEFIVDEAVFELALRSQI